MATIWMTKKHGGRAGGGGNTGSGVFIGKSGSTDRNGVVRQQLAIAFRLDVMKAMRWTVGDHILVGFDPESETITLRRGAGGFHLSPRTRKKGDNQVGACVSGVIKFAAPDFVTVDSSRPVPLSDCAMDGVDLVVPASGMMRKPGAPE